MSVTPSNPDGVTSHAPLLSETGTTLTATWGDGELCADFSLTQNALAVELKFTVSSGPGLLGKGSYTRDASGGTAAETGACAGTEASRSCVSLATPPTTRINACIPVTAFSDATQVLVEGVRIDFLVFQTVATTVVRPPVVIDVAVNKFEDVDGDGEYHSGIDLPVEGVEFCLVPEQNSSCTGALTSGTTDGTGSLVFPDVSLGAATYLTEGPTADFYPTAPASGRVRIDPQNPPAQPHLFLNFWYGTLAGVLEHDWYARGSLGPGACGVTEFADGGTCQPCAMAPAGSVCGQYPGQIALRLNPPNQSPSTIQIPVASNGTFQYGTLPAGEYVIDISDPRFRLSEPVTGTGASRLAANRTLYYYLPARYRWRPVDPASGSLIIGGSSHVRCDGEADPRSVAVGADGLATWSDVRPGLTCRFEYDPPAGWELSTAAPADFLTRSGDDYTVEIELVRTPSTWTIFKRYDRRGNGVADSDDPPAPGVEFCADLDLDGACSPGEQSVATDDLGSAQIVVPGTHEGPFDIREVVDPTQTVAVHPPGGWTRVPAGAQPDVLTFLNARLGTIEVELFHDRYLQGDAGPNCAYGGEPSAPASSVCTDCAVGAAGDLCRSRPSRISLRSVQTCNECAVPFETVTLDVADGIAVGQRVPPGLFEAVPSPGEIAWRFQSPEQRLLDGETQSLRVGVWRTAALQLRFGADSDQDGLIGPGEGVPGGLVSVFSPAQPGGDPVHQSVSSDPGGQVLVTGLVPGTRVELQYVLPEGWTLHPMDSLPDGFVPESGGSTRVDIRLVPSAVGIYALAYIDEDGDGTRSQAEQPLDGVIIDRLSADGTVIESVSTGAIDLDGDGTISADGERGLAYFESRSREQLVIRQRPQQGMRITEPLPDGSYTIDPTSTAGSSGWYLFGNEPYMLDFGDAPDAATTSDPDAATGYPVRLASDGARHLLSGIVWLGAGVDEEPDGLPDGLALGDDRNSDDDEDGTSFDDGTPLVDAILPGDPSTPIMIVGNPRVGLALTPSAVARLDAWLDWNRDGDWMDAGEQIARRAAVVPPSDTLWFSVPREASTGISFLRLRLSSAGGLDATGLAMDGEVEDHRMLIARRFVVDAVDDTGDANPGDMECADGSGRCTLRAALEEAGIGRGFALVDLTRAGKLFTSVFQPGRALPVLNGPVILDGGGTAVLDGSLAGPSTNGLEVTGNGAVISGLAVRGFGGNGMVVRGEAARILGSRVERNGKSGVRFHAGSGRVMNSTFSQNGGLAIDRGAEGPDTENTPELTEVLTRSGMVRGRLPDGAGPWTLELFASSECDPSGFGEADRLIHRAEIDDVGSQRAAFELSEVGGLLTGESLSATVTGSDGVTTEFSACVPVLMGGTGAVAEDPLPARSSLSTNYPNPFTVVTTIPFSLRSSGHARLTVYDVLGRAVRELLDGTMPAGAHAIRFDSTGLPAGVYVCRLETAEAIDTLVMTHVY